MAELFAIATSILALVVSIGTAWLTFFFRGRLRMTAPSMLAFAYDSRGVSSAFDAKVTVRTLLFTTGTRGHAIETLFLRLRRADSTRTFAIWGLDVEKLQRGGGLFVGQNGVTAWHHFVLPPGEPEFHFRAGEYELALSARVDGRRAPVLLWRANVHLPEPIAPTQHDGGQQVWFDRDPASEAYVARIENAAR